MLLNYHDEFHDITSLRRLTIFRFLLHYFLSFISDDADGFTLELNTARHDFRRARAAARSPIRHTPRRFRCRWRLLRAAAVLLESSRFVIEQMPSHARWLQLLDRHKASKQTPVGDDYFIRHTFTRRLQLLFYITRISPAALSTRYAAVFRLSMPLH